MQLPHFGESILIRYMRILFTFLNFLICSLFSLVGHAILVGCYSNLVVHLASCRGYFVALICGRQLLTR